MKKLRVGLIGAGNIARVIASNVSDDITIVCVYDQLTEKAEAFAKRYKCRFLKVDEFPKLDLVVEAASQDAVAEYGERTLEKGSNFMVMSVGAFSDESLFQRLKNKAEEKGLRILIPSGALVGLDGLKAAKRAGLDEVELITTKNPKSFEDSDYLREGGIRVSEIRAKTLLFEGEAKEAIRHFPKNINVAATLSLIGLGFKKTKVRIYADPGVAQNIHEVIARGKFGELHTKTMNIPSPDNPKTSYLAALSALTVIEDFASSVRVGN
ncbi:MAG: aspartate dehydrogenase [Candidatus Altiarchaeota archaeon]|nr:aspartate dehydrogenase [Candidatus Altiarchaeota archaeon]